MALLCMEGFDHLDTNADLTAKGWSTGSAYIAADAVGRFEEGKALKVDMGPAYTAQKIWGNKKTTIYFGVALKRETGTPRSSLSYPFLRFRDELGTTQIKLHVTATNGLKIYNGDDTLIGSSTDGIFTENLWHYLEGKIIINATTGEVTLNWNGVEVFSDTAADTKNGTDYLDSIGFYYVYLGLDLYVDDLWVDDSQSHGNCHIKTFMPDVDGVHSDLTRNTGSNDYECIDEIPPNDDTDYVKGSTVGNKSTFGITTGSLETVKAIQVNNDLRITSAGTRKVKTLVRSNGVDYQSAESDGLLSAFNFKSAIWETDPDDSAVWTQTKLEAAEFGVEITT